MSMDGMVTRSIVPYGLVVAFLIQAGGPAASEATARPRNQQAKAQVLAEKGVKLFKSAKYKAALELFVESREMGKVPGVAWNIGRCYEELGVPESALPYFEVSFKEARNPRTREDSKRKVEAIRKKLEAVLKVNVSESGAKIQVDGEVMHHKALASGHRLPAGRHVVTVSKKGFLTSRQRLDLRPMEILELKVLLKPDSGRSQSTAVDGENGKTQPRFIPYVDRGLTIRSNKVHVGLDLTVGLHEGFAGEQVLIDTAYFADRYGGLSLGYGFGAADIRNSISGAQFEGAEICLCLQALYWDESSGTDFGGLYLYGKIAFVEYLGLEMGFKLFGYDVSTNRVRLNLGIPFEYVIIEGQLKIFARPDFYFWFLKDDFTIYMVIDGGLAFNVIPHVFFEIFSGVNVGLLNPIGFNTSVPFGIRIGSTPLHWFDVSLAWTFWDLYGAKADLRSLTLSTEFRFF